jgi:hypothetical protein
MARSFALVSLLLATHTAAAQGITPQLSKIQREMLRQIVAAVDAASGEPDTPDTIWQTHLLRASDGSHYVAFSLESPSRIETQTGPLMLYVRLASTAASGQGVERSAVGDWLAGRRSDPLLRPRTGIAIGEMPAFGAAGIIEPRPGRPVATPTGSNDLKLLQLERERERKEKEERDRQRRAELEGAAKVKRELLPFEDFDLTAVPVPETGALQRALTAGPGDYELYVAWSEATAKPGSRVHVAKRRLQLPPASASELSISSVILADRVAVRTLPYPAPQQAAHPYTVGLTEITPARDTVFSRDDRLSVAFQVINAHPSETGKPDIAITFRIVRVNGDREQPVASLTPQQYNATTLPAEFDLRVGHPIFAAMSAPLATLTRGTYRLKIAVTDRLSGRGTSGDADFTVVGTPASLLAEAPSLGAPFTRELALDQAVIDEIVASLRPPSPSPALGRALETLRQRRFVELMREEPVASDEAGIRTALTAVALFALGDASSAVQFQRARQLTAPGGPTQFFVGAARALEGREADAVAAWQAAMDAGMNRSLMIPLLVNSHLRRGDIERATSLLEGQEVGGWGREQAALHIANGHHEEAIVILERRLASSPGDADAEWLRLHALFASMVNTTKPDQALKEKCQQAAKAYLSKPRANAALAAEWLKVIEAAPRP